jgi:2-polyprenyl-6-methoxyphenol hydroxylase-like FAD-dependent oxidoreductase
MSEVDVIVIGGGPAGSAAARLLARWGHRVRLLTKPADISRGAAESLPPSTRKLLATIGVLDRVERAAFYRTTGNTVWWGERHGDVERFGRLPAAERAEQAEQGEAAFYGYQVFRPTLDRLMLTAAADAGAEVIADAYVPRVRLPGSQSAAQEWALIDCQRGGQPAATMACRYVLDASGRAGVIARQGFRVQQPGFRTQAFIGGWQSERGWTIPDPTHTLVETYEDGWAWSVPLSPTERQVGVAVDGATTRIARGPTLHETYRAELGKARHLGALMSTATLDHVWACDASCFKAREYGGPGFLLLGDAGSCIDPLSSFGIKKALASAWIGAIAVDTCLTHPERSSLALEFFSNWERDVYAANLRQSVAFAREAYNRHSHPFWAERAGVKVEEDIEELDEERLFRAKDVQATFESLKESAAVAFTRSDRVCLKSLAVIRDREIVMADAFELPEAPRGIRFLAGVDLLKLSKVACVYRQVPDIFDAYCRAHGAVALPSFLGALSFLVARGILRQR